MSAVRGAAAFDVARASRAMIVARAGGSETASATIVGGVTAPGNDSMPRSDVEYPTDRITLPLSVERPR